MGSALTQRACTVQPVICDRADAMSLREPYAASANTVNAAIIAGRKSALAEQQLGYGQAASIIADRCELSASSRIEATGRKTNAIIRHFGLSRRGAEPHDEKDQGQVHAPTLHSAASRNVVQHLYL